MPASAAPTPNVNRKVRSTLMPITRAARLSCVTARIALPVMVWRRNRCRPIVISVVATSVTNCTTLTRRSPTVSTAAPTCPPML